MMGIFSGLFEAPACCICQGKAGLLNRYKLRDGSYICGKCAGQCSEELTETEFARMETVNAQEAMELHRQRADWYVNDFVTGMVFHQSGTLGSDVLAIDEQHSLFANLSRSEPEAFPLSAITGHSLRLETEDRDPNDRDDGPSAMGGLVDLAVKMATGSPELLRRDFPVCPAGQKVKSMYLVFYVNVPYLRSVKLPMIGTAFPGRADVEAGYRLADQILTYLDNLQAEMSNAAEQAAQHSEATLQAQPASGDSQAAGMADASEALKKLKELLDAGILTQEEFTAKKKQILGL